MHKYKEQLESEYEFNLEDTYQKMRIPLNLTVGTSTARHVTTMKEKLKG